MDDQSDADFFDNLIEEDELPPVSKLDTPKKIINNQLDSVESLDSNLSSSEPVIESHAIVPLEPVIESTAIVSSQPVIESNAIADQAVEALSKLSLENQISLSSESEDNKSSHEKLGLVGDNSRLGYHEYPIETRSEAGDALGKRDSGFSFGEEEPVVNSVASKPEKMVKSMPEIREIQWSSFHASSSSEMGGFGSYSDFFSSVSSNPSDPVEGDFYTTLSTSQSNAAPSIQPPVDMGYQAGGDFYSTLSTAQSDVISPLHATQGVNANTALEDSGGDFFSMISSTQSRTISPMQSIQGVTPNTNFQVDDSGGDFYSILSTTENNTVSHMQSTQGVAPSSNFKIGNSGGDFYAKLGAHQSDDAVSPMQPTQGVSSNGALQFGDSGDDFYAMLSTAQREPVPSMPSVQAAAPSNAAFQVGDSGEDFYSKLSGSQINTSMQLAPGAGFQVTQGEINVTSSFRVEASAIGSQTSTANAFENHYKQGGHEGYTNEYANEYGTTEGVVSSGDYQYGTAEGVFSSGDYQYGTAEGAVSAEEYQQPSSDVVFWENAYWKYDGMTGQWFQVENYEAVSSRLHVSENGNVEQSHNNSISQDTHSTTDYSSWQAQNSDDLGHGNVDGTVNSVTTVNGELTNSNDNANLQDSFMQDVPDQTGYDWNQASQGLDQQNTNSVHATNAYEQVSEYDSQGKIVSSSPSPDVADTYTQPTSQDNIWIDPNYPGWYYDLVQQKWFELEEKTRETGVHAYESVTTHDQLEQTKRGLDSASDNDDRKLYNGSEVTDEYGSVASTNNWQNSYDNRVYPQENTNGSFNVNHNVYTPASNVYGQVGQFGTSVPYGHYDNSQTANTYQMDQNSQYYMDPKQPFNNAYQANQNSQYHMDQSQSYYSYHENSGNTHEIHQQNHLQNTNPPFPNLYKEGRSSAGRPPCTLVTFGFGGRFAIFSSNLTGVQEGGHVSLYNLGQLVNDNSVNGYGPPDNYFNSLSHQAFSAPLVGGSPTSKEISKWMDEKIAFYEKELHTCKNAEHMCLLLSSLKIFCQHYGKFRNSGDSQESDGPEIALTKLLSAAKPNYSVEMPCLQSLPSESHFQMAALEMKNLLVAGKRIEALSYAQQSQLWGLALVLAWRLGEQYYVETVKLMAQQQFPPGSPLRTLFLLLAGQQSDLFTKDNPAALTQNQFGAMSQAMYTPELDSTAGMLNNWQENLSIITANRTQGDECVIVHLGDCLWKERGEVEAAHICYLIAAANFEYYSNSARLCLIGADHMKFPRSYASPEAIQRTELYEYGRTLGNPQYILLPFQPYKLLYSSMLAEVGKMSEAMKYCQSVTKVLKNAGRAPEVELCKQLASSMEERLRVYSQGGYGSNLAPAKLVGRFISTLDRSIHRIIGGPLPSEASTQQNPVQNSSQDAYSGRPGGTNPTHRQSAVALSEMTADYSQVNLQTRSISLPDFTQSQEKNHTNVTAENAETAASKAKGDSGPAGGQSKLGRFGSTLFQKAVGLIAKTNKNEVKLGESNKFYYDEKLKRWVEEGAAPPAEEATLSAPPTNMSFLSKAKSLNASNPMDNSPSYQGFHNSGTQNKTPSDHSSGTPPIPPSSNQFSARGRMQGVRSRYVDTFNKGGSSTPTKSFQAPVVPVARLGGLPPAANFFVPTPAGISPSTAETDSNEAQATGAASPSTSENGPDGPGAQYQGSACSEDKFKSPSTLHRYSSADNVRHFTNKGTDGSEIRSAPLSSQSRAASWSGAYPKSLRASDQSEVSSNSDGKLYSYSSTGGLRGNDPPNFDLSKTSLPSPPSIEPHSATFREQFMAPNEKGDRISNKFNVDNFVDELQEVEL